jgi:FlaA1/EpsC-like NDP-sugar epimerase
MLSMLKRRNFWIMIGADALLCFGAYFAAYVIRFDGAVPRNELHTIEATVVWVISIKLVFLFSFGIYRGMWRYTGVHDLLNLVKGIAASTAMILFIILFLYRFHGFSRGVFVIDFLLCLILLGSFRLAVRVTAAYPRGKDLGNGPAARPAPLKRLVIIGAGRTGEKLLRELKENRRLNYNVVGFVDDNLSKLRLTIHGVAVLGTLSNLSRIVKDHVVDEIIIAVPSASAAEMRRLVGFCKSADVAFKTVPGIGELIEGKVTVSALRKVRYEDLLGREPVEIDVDGIGQYLTGRRVLVTGAAGSIGAELCRQIARFAPDRLIMVDRSESGLYDIEMELRGARKEVSLVPVLAAIQNRTLVARSFEAYKPEVVLHAAAYKHVPIMEIHPWEAVFNNIVGTETVLDLCHHHRVGRCVVVSTDKAVRPTNVMGASKRFAELLAQSHSYQNGCRFMCVRFGNVIGSAGSVVPLFRKQIAQGGPITVTHKEMKRYFMTIPEACRLILQTGAIGKGGEIFVLKMGAALRIDDVAREMIALSGLKPDEDIEINYIGLRPGEKLFEELVTEGEDLVPTGHNKIMILRSRNGYSMKLLRDSVKALVQLAMSGNSWGLKEELQRMIPEYTPYREVIGTSVRIGGSISTNAASSRK